MRWTAKSKRLSWLASVAALLVAVDASACGVSASGVASCSLEEHNEAVRPRWLFGFSGLYTSTRLRFTGDVEADQTRYATLATLAYLPTPRLVLQASLGVALGGSLSAPDGRHEFSAGPIAALGAGFRVLDDGRFFLLFTSVLSFAAARTQLASEPAVNYEAFDLRLGGEFGVELARMFRPYAALRVFGGPVLWHYAGEAVTGTDTHHYQVGAGLAVRLSRRVNVFAEGIPLGERAVSLGAGLSF